ncbi:DUF4105 domain-containing protein [uncultured Flavobacterium sp.]|uniref:lipoprotein N-acyltransferase Lnb domain-containing protein n=1 Tax=uncultured Flavobacterium sp. TaxID=165435 RepID=UPI0030ECBB15|tara:strand:+ start:17 stop:1126 length:1110 start_codon:yes stop_codon:yes gene_type:complete
MGKKLLSFLFLIVFFQGFSQDLQVSENAKVSIITIGTASPSYALYGHTGIRFKDITTNLDVVFNYGAFDFETPNFMLRFVKGDLQYFVTSNPFADFEYSYRHENRSIYEQELDLPIDKIRLLYNNINNSLTSDERFYTYKFIDKNCTTMVIDKVNEVIDSKAIDFQKPQEQTYRSVLFPYANEQFLQQLGINIIFGTKVDEKATKLFLPLDLMEQLKTVKYNGKPLVTRTSTIFEAQKETPPFNFFDSIYLLIVLLGIIVLLNNRKLTFVYFSILGLLGLFFSLIGLYSFHEEVLWNYNVLLFNPFYLVLLYFFYRNNVQKIKRVKWFILLLLVIYVILVINKVYLISVLPIILTNFILLLRTKTNQSK